MASQTASPARIADQFLRATAIFMVFAIHFMASLHKSPYISGAPFQFWAVTFDQLFRVSVPLFVALSGYGLSQKYTVSHFHWGEFFKNRVLKLLPLYIGWSFFYYVTLRIVPQWSPNWQTSSIWQQLLWGEADYQMYFVPMIFQLYVLFPLLLALRKKWPKITFIGAFVMQLFFFWFYQEQARKLIHVNWTDQLQYIFFGAWIFYFMLGMYLQQILTLVRKAPFGKATVLTGVLVAAYLMISNALHNINTGFDPIDALRSTRFTVMFYSSTMIVASVWLAMKIKKIPRIIQQIGIHSYNIYLGHTFILRVIFTFLLPK